MSPRNTTAAAEDEPTNTESLPPAPEQPADLPADPVPSLARMVLVLGDVACHNGADVAPAMVTRVWGEHPDGGHTVNLVVFPDGYMPRHAFSVPLYADEQTARKSKAGQHGAAVAYWPPRV